MNNDDYKERQYLRNYNLKKNMDSSQIKCKDVKEYADQQNTFYDPKTNQMLYGISSNMKAAGVSNGTCNQVNPLIYTDRDKCGAGTAGGNPCIQNSYNKIFNNKENFESSLKKTLFGNTWSTEIIIFLLLIMLILYFGCDSENN